MAQSVAEKRAKFRKLHESGLFLLPNPWDVGSARLFASMGFDALATTSTGYAWTTGRPDYAVTREDVLAHLSALNEATDLPINADFESGFGVEPNEVAENVKLAIKAGVSGISIEDRKLGDLEKLYDTTQSVERIRAARKAIDESGEDVIVVGRTEGLLVGGNSKDAIDKLVKLAEAGADCLYAPGLGTAGLSTIEEAKTLVAAVSPRTVNVLVMGPGITFKEYEDAGVRRLSVGGAVALHGWAAVKNAAQAFKDGTYEGLAGGLPGAELNAAFEKYN